MATSVYQHEDLGSFLRDGFVPAIRRGDRARPSISATARHLGCRARSGLVMVLSGRRLPSRDMTRRIATYLGLDTGEHRYLEMLVEKARAEAAGRSTAAIVAAMHELNPRRTDQIDLTPARFAYVAEWFHLPLSLAVGAKGGRVSIAALEKRFRGKVSAKELHEGLARLCQLGILERDERGRYLARVAPVKVNTDAPIPSAAVRSHHRQMLARAAEALEEVGVDEREFGAVTIGLERARLAEAKAAVAAFKEQFRKRFHSDACADVVQLNLQLFYHTQPSDAPTPPRAAVAPGATRARGRIAAPPAKNSAEGTPS
jgi:uncharacterized protein (TIGR02147 family)